MEYILRKNRYKFKSFKKWIFPKKRFPLQYVPHVVLYTGSLLHLKTIYLLLLLLTSIKNNYQSLVCVKNNTTFRFSSLVYGLYAKQCFSGTKVNWCLINKKMSFYSVFASFLLSVLLCIYSMHRWESWNFGILCT